MNRISHSWLLSKLRKTAQIRALITVTSCILGLALLSAIPEQSSPLVGLAVLFGWSWLVVWIVTKAYCEKAVVCPYCGGSLWKCGTGNFKPRKMHVRDDARECPHCQVPLGTSERAD